MSIDIRTLTFVDDVDVCLINQCKIFLPFSTIIIVISINIIEAEFGIRC